MRDIRVTPMGKLIVRQIREDRVDKAGIDYVLPGVKPHDVLTDDNLPKDKMFFRPYREKKKK